MALILFDGFDYRNDDSYTSSKWDYDYSVDWVTTGGRRNGGRVFMNDDGDYLSKYIPAQDTYICGVAMYHHGDISNADNFIHFKDASVNQIHIQCSNYSSGTANIVALRNGTVLGTSATKCVVTDTWQYIEVKAVIHDTTGSVTIKIDGTTVLELTGIDTDANSSGQITEFQLSGLASDISFDDFYLLDDTGANNNNFLGDVKVITLLPTANGSYAQMTPVTGTNYENVDDTDLDFDTYNTADAINETDTFTVTSPTALPTIYGLQIASIAQNADTGVRKIKNLIYKNTTVYLSSDELTLSYTWLNLSTIWETDPVDSMSWSKEKIDAAQFGVRLTQ